MRKALLILCCLTLITGCNNKKNLNNDILQFSDFKYEDNYIIGKIKNTSNKNYKVTMDFELKNNTLKENETCYIDVKPNETKDLKCIALDYNNDYEVNLSDFRTEEFETPKLEEGEINEDTLKYYFEDIYLSHYRFMVSIDTEGNYPRFEEVKYKDNEIELSNTIEFDDYSYLLILEFFDVNTQNRKYLSVITSSKKESIHNDIISSFQQLDSSNLEEIRNVLNKETKKGRCYVVDDYCYSKYKEDNATTYSMVIKDDNLTPVNNSYEDIYNEYSKRLKNECPVLSMSECAKISNEGIEKMANYMLKASGIDGQYSTYEKWSDKLMDVYMKEAR